MTTLSAAHTKYRPDIDGLRAIAVISVVIFHAFPNLIPGGYIGVDIFFVISGYLISTIIMGSLEKGSFSILDFYDRRIRRIFPALILVMVSSLAFGYWVLIATEYSQLSKHVAGGATYIANFMFWRESGYFDSSGETKPMLHLWSLAIEEQFYIFWPILLGLVWKRKWSFLKITLGIAALSFAANIALASTRPTAAFFLPPSRFWELMVGGTLAYLLLHRPQLFAKQKNLQSLLGLSFIAIGLTFITSKSMFPGWWALLPTFGAFLIISAGKDAWFNKHILSSKAAVGIGLISYPLYLWHWPLFSFLRISTESNPGALLLIAAIAASIVLACLTYFFVEKKIRFANNRYISPVLLILMLGIISCSVFVIHQQGLPDRKAAIKLDYLTGTDIFEASRNSNSSCKDLLGLNPLAEEVCLASSKTPQILIMGDSHAMALHSSIYSQDFSYDAVMVAAHSCPMYPNVEITQSVKKSWGHYCSKIAKEALRVAEETKSITTVLISHNYAGAESDVGFDFHFNNKVISYEDAFVIGNDYVIKKLLASGKKVVFVIDVPRLRLPPTECLQRFSNIKPNECRFTEVEHTKLREHYLSLVAKIKANNPDLITYDPTNLFCHDGFCQIKIGDHYLYNDVNHLSVTGSKFVLDDMKIKGYLNGYK